MQIINLPKCVKNYLKSCVICHVSEIDFQRSEFREKWRTLLCGSFFSWFQKGEHFHKKVHFLPLNNELVFVMSKDNIIIYRSKLIFSVKTFTFLKSVKKTATKKCSPFCSKLTPLKIYFWHMTNDTWFKVIFDTFW